MLCRPLRATFPSPPQVGNGRLIFRLARSSAPHGERWNRELWRMSRDDEPIITAYSPGKTRHACVAARLPEVRPVCRIIERTCRVFSYATVLGLRALLPGGLAWPI